MGESYGTPACSGGYERWCRLIGSSGASKEQGYDVIGITMQMGYNPKKTLLGKSLVAADAL